MVVRRLHCSLRKRGSLMIELLVAMVILSTVLLPIAYSIATERRLARSIYQRAVAVEIVDGEMEALVAGGWRAFTNGVSDYPVHAGALTNLPPGQFILTLTPSNLRLEWRPNIKQHGGPVVREVVRK